MEGEFAALLERLPPIDLTDVAALRRVLSARPTRQLTTRPDLEIRHVSVPGRSGRDVPIRLYLPKQRSQPSPGLLYCHGGGFVMGSLDSDHERCVRLAAEGGAVVVSPDYRLAPEHRYPAGLDDCLAALIWMRECATEIGVDPSRLAIGGTSAGAALATGVALRVRDEAGPPLLLLLLASPVADRTVSQPSISEFWASPGWNGAATTLMWQHYLPADGSPAPYAAPTQAVSLHGLPPTEIVIAELDPLRDEGLDLARRLGAAEVPVTVHHYYGVPHGFDALLPHAEASARSIGTQVSRLARLTTTSHVGTPERV